ncbi:MAG: cysteine desulfurase family protein [Candidatus Omnitrophota bacterium]
MERHIYLDHNATTPLHPAVKKAIIEGLDIFGNPSSFHSFGREARQRVEEARNAIASFINAEADELFFVGSGSEANNTVLSILPCDKRDCICNLKTTHKIITTKIEHPCILESAKCLSRKGSSVLFLEVDEYGKVLKDDFRKCLSTGDVGLVSIMMANNEIGTIQDIKELVQMAHEKGALFHTDAVQAVGKIPIDVKDLNVDFLTISAHKIYGPKGIGALYVKKNVRFCPLIVGGHQEKGRRAGTENTLGIIGFGKAVEMRRKEMQEEEGRLLSLKNRMKQQLINTVPDIRFNGHPADCLPGTLNISFTGVEGESVLLYLDLEGIAVSTGSACASGSLDPSHVLLATGLAAEQAHGSIRISLGRDNTDEETDYTVQKIQEVVKRLRKMSTAY